MADKTIQAIGIPWYAEEKYARVLQVMEDAHLLPLTFNDWLSRAEQALQHYKDHGFIAVKAYIDPDAFVGWCRSRHLNVDAAARTQFASAIAKAHVREGHG